MPWTTTAEGILRYKPKPLIQGITPIDTRYWVSDQFCLGGLTGPNFCPETGVATAFDYFESAARVVLPCLSSVWLGTSNSYRQYNNPDWNGGPCRGACSCTGDANYVEDATRGLLRNPDAGSTAFTLGVVSFSCDPIDITYRLRFAVSVAGERTPDCPVGPHLNLTQRFTYTIVVTEP